MKNRKRILAAIILSVYVTGFFLPAAAADAADAAAAGFTEITLVVKQVFTIAGADAPPEGTFGYRLTPALPSDPMPSGGMAESYDFDITGTADKHVSIRFAAAGVYTYELSHTTAPAPGYTYDHEVYTLKIAVYGDLTYTVLIYKRDGKKAEDIYYGHAYGSGVPPGDPGSDPEFAPAGPEGPRTVKNGPGTGDGFSVLLYAVLLYAAGIAALMIWYLSFSGRRRGDTNK